MEPLAGPFASLSNDELEDQITELTGHLNAANYRWLMLIAEFDQRCGWGGAKIHSCAHWLNYKCGLNLGAAREKVRVAHALISLPKISASMARGELSYSKVRALTRVADEITEEPLLNIALHGTAHHVETLVRHFRRANQADALAQETRQHEMRSMRYWYDHDGSVVFQGRLPAIAGTAFIKAIDAALEVVPDAESFDDPERSDPKHLSWECRRADALALMTEAYLQHGPAKQSTADRFQVVVHVDAATLKDRKDGRCEVEEGPSIPIETARRIACDASLVRITENESGEPLDVGRKTRSIPFALRRALKARDEGCQFPGCTFNRYVDAHHIEHWADGGETKISNLITLCRAHHRMVHNNEIIIEGSHSDGWRFMNLDRVPFQGPYCQRSEPHEWRNIHEINEANGIYIDKKTAVTRWCGEIMDYDLAVFMLGTRVNYYQEHPDAFPRERFDEQPP
jgi:Domain of unknown function (DUF222)/HNH endonuclease